MIQPKQRSQQLVDDIQQTQVPVGSVAIWWLGQSGYAVKTTNHLLYFDLYLSEHLTQKYAETDKPHIRMTESPLRGHEITNAGLVFSSHKHSDHLDPGTMPDVFTASPNARLVLPGAIVEHAVSLGLDRARLIPTRGDERLEVDGVVIHSIPAAHPGLDFDESSGYPFLGFVVEVDGITLYHSGDTLVYDGLAERLRAFDIDIAFLPINGTDDRRTALKVPPNMNLHDAIQLAQDIHAKLLIPHHYDMFTFNTVEVGDFIVAIAPTRQAYQVLQCGEKFIYSP